MKTRLLVALIVGLSFAPTTARSGERGLTNYLAGYYGDFAVAVQPAQGLYAYATAYRYAATSEGPRGSSDLELQGTLAITGFQYVSPWRVLGARFAVAAYTTYVEGDLTANVAGGFHGQEEGPGDSSVSPLVLYWQAGQNLHISFYQSIILPTGSFNAEKAVNTGRNYFSFDTVLALTWLDPKLGIEVSLVPGLMINTENDATRYRTGSEFHIDGMANIFFNTNFAVGLHGYYYRQIADDEVASVATGLRARSMGIGPAILWTPSQGTGKIVGKWLHEANARDRFKGDIFSLTTVLRF